MFSLWKKIIEIQNFLATRFVRLVLAGLTNEYNCAHEAQMNFGDLTPYLAYAMDGGYANIFLRLFAHF
jgi:hypothetical protein